MVNKWCYWRSKATQEKLNLQVSIPSSIPVIQSRINESWNQAPLLSIYQDWGKLDVIFYFLPMLTGPLRNLCTKVPKHIRDIFYSCHQELERHNHNKNCCNVCEPRVLCQPTFDSSKHGLKSSTKLQQSKWLLWS